LLYAYGICTLLASEDTAGQPLWRSHLQHAHAVFHAPTGLADLRCAFKDLAQSPSKNRRCWRQRSDSFAICDVCGMPVRGAGWQKIGVH
jgi:hypothetical protein